MVRMTGHNRREYGRVLHQMDVRFVKIEVSDPEPECISTANARRMGLETPSVSLAGPSGIQQSVVQMFVRHQSRPRAQAAPSQSVSVLILGSLCPSHSFGWMFVQLILSTN